MSDERAFCEHHRQPDLCPYCLRAEVERLNRALDNMRAEYKTNLDEAEAEVKRLREALQSIVDTPRGRDGEMRAIAAQTLRSDMTALPPEGEP